ncbi:hypothetical protein [Nocardia wallacei]|uniref:hypothetical protein n=1 Tax=Nocardia wallacei TaxID=480035 RepID=UPI00245790D7|nr:hypothetical protein [Nocardia wallacei]
MTETEESAVAVGVICLPLVQDPDAAEAELERLAVEHGKQLVETLRVWPKEPGWLFRLLETVNAKRAVAVVALDLEHIGACSVAVVGAADLITRTETRKYVGYGTPGVRPGSLPAR